MRVTYPEMVAVFGRIGLLSFGGPAAQIGLMHRELVDRRPWLDERQFLSALSFCMFLPGPEAMQLATFAGWRLRGIPGGLVAGGLFVLPGALVILALTAIYIHFGSQQIVQSMFLGVKAAVVVIVLQALIAVAKRALAGPADRVLALLAFLGIFALGLPFPVIVLAAALWGAVATSAAPAAARPAPPPARHSLTILAAGLALWAAPVALAAALGAERLTAIGLFFSRLAVVTFGGAYAVLAYMTQQVVQTEGWLTTAQMMDGLGLAETTPGPLILVTQFVGTLAAYQQGGWGAGLLGAAMTLWVTFVPCFVWIFVGAPYVDWITHQPRLAGALHGIMAAVVGVIANLSLWFALHVVFAEVGLHGAGPLRLPWPQLSSIDPLALALAALAALLLIGRGWPLGAVLAVSAVAGGLAGGL
ncbi:chromate efflux transporter [Tropicimonas sp. IMCC34043]|uniref:chromate efflux transporter n=1 Tax=Tropicimonas sp. IMCC34043 TaxID=2248760 RepID=UPI000E238C54|nr:chromate efflux transporter [Tropicimonas sp. IMCC34043]